MAVAAPRAVEVGVEDDDNDADRQRLAGAVSNMIQRRDDAGVLPVEDCGGGPGAGRGTAEDEDHNNNTTIKQCMGEGGADDDGGDRRLAVGDVDNDRRQQRQALEGEDNGGGLGRHFGRGGGEWQQTAAAEKGCGGQRRGGGRLWDMKRAYGHNIALSKVTTAQTILRREGRPDIAHINSINLSYRMQ